MAVDSQEYRAAMSNWPSGVAVVAVRDDGRVIATTVSALLSLSLDPPQLLFSLSPNATVRPYVVAGAAVGVSLLGAAQRRLASVFADPFPVGPDPFGECTPLVRGAMTAFACTVTDVRVSGDHAIVIAVVESVSAAGGEPVVRQGGRYRTLAP